MNDRPDSGSREAAANGGIWVLTAAKLGDGPPAETARNAFFWTDPHRVAYAGSTKRDELMDTGNDALANAVHVLQQALTPVFLLSAIGALLNVFATRLGRVADQTDMLAAQAEPAPGREARLKRLRRRSHALDVAVVLAALAGGLTCATVLVLFLSELIGKAAAGILFGLFAGAVVLSLGSIGGFVVEMLLAARGVRLAVANIENAEAKTLEK